MGGDGFRILLEEDAIELKNKIGDFWSKLTPRVKKWPFDAFLSAFENWTSQIAQSDDFGQYKDDFDIFDRNRRFWKILVFYKNT